MEFTIKKDKATVPLIGKNGARWDVPLARAICTDQGSKILDAEQYHFETVNGDPLVTFDIISGRSEKEPLEAVIRRKTGIAQAWLSDEIARLWTLEDSLKVIAAARGSEKEVEADD